MGNILIEGKIDKEKAALLLIITIILFAFVWSWPLAILYLLKCLSYRKQKLQVTNTNVSGACGRYCTKKFDIPIDDIKRVGYISGTGNLYIVTSLKTIRFSCLLNAEAIADTLNKLLKENRKADENTSDATANSCDTDQIIKFKKLMDDGIITQEEFDAKKKQLLGL